jgi:hypothetical protein
MHLMPEQFNRIPQAYQAYQHADIVARRFQDNPLFFGMNWRNPLSKRTGAALRKCVGVKSRDVA